MAAGHSIRSLGLPIALFDDLVSAFGQDIMTTRYASWRDVLDYCRRSANPVGRLVLRIAGYRDDRLDRSSDALCTALQLTNFWQDLGTDWRIGRLYVPAETVRAAGASEDTLGGERLTDAWADAIEACVAFTRERFAEGRTVCDRRARTASRRAAAHLARRHAHSRARRAGALRPAPSSADARRRRRAAAALARARLVEPPRERAIEHDVTPGVEPRVARPHLMARKTSFYYSFLVLPAEQRRAIVAVWDFCRAVDDAVDESAGGRRRAADRTRRDRFWRAELARCFDAASRRRARAAVCSRSPAPSICPGRRSTM